MLVVNRLKNDFTARLFRPLCSSYTRTHIRLYTFLNLTSKTIFFSLASFSFFLGEMHFHPIFLFICYLLKRNWNSPCMFFFPVLSLKFSVALCVYHRCHHKMNVFKCLLILKILIVIFALEMIFMMFCLKDTSNIDCSQCRKFKTSVSHGIHVEHILIHIHIWIQIESSQYSKHGNRFGMTSSARKSGIF